MKVNFGELRISDTAKGHILDCLATNQVSCGPKVALFEEKWKKLFHHPYTVAVNSGTSADIAACLALYEYGAKPGDFIICPALSFIATANAIRAAGFTPLFVDVKKETLNIDESLLNHRISDIQYQNHDKRIVAIMTVNLMGKPSRLDIIADIAHKYNLKVIVDNCEAYGSKFQNQYALHYADFETTSHYIAHIVCGCELGTVSCKTEKDRDLILSVRSHGRQPNSLYFNHQRYGLNLKPSDLHASIALGEVDDFKKIFWKRKENLQAFYDAAEPFKDKVYLVEEDEDAVNAPHGFSITLKESCNKLKNIAYLEGAFSKKEIASKRNFGSMPDHTAFSYLGYDKGAFPNATYIGKWGDHIGCHYWMTDEQVEYVSESIREILGKL